MSMSRTLLVVATLLIGLSIPALALARPAALAVSGTVTATNFKPIASNGQMYVSIWETPKGAAARRLGSPTVTNISGRTPPFAFTVQLTNPVATSIYEVEVLLAEGGAVRYKNQPRTHILTSSPGNLNVVVAAASGGLPQFSSGSGRLLLGLALAALAAGVAAWRRGRARPGGQATL